MLKYFLPEADFVYHLVKVDTTCTRLGMGDKYEVFQLIHLLTDSGQRGPEVFEPREGEYLDTTVTRSFGNGTFSFVPARLHEKTRQLLTDSNFRRTHYQTYRETILPFVNRLGIRDVLNYMREL